MKLIYVYGFMAGVLAQVDILAQTWRADGNLKYQLFNINYPRDSIFQDFVGSDVTDHSLSARLNLKYKVEQWSVNTSYQLTGLYADSLEYFRSSEDSLLFRPSIQNDDERLFDLTHMSSEGGKDILIGRVDRIYLTYQNDSSVIKIGRQAVSWGNGLTYTPMDFLNPFDPAAIDTEYKTGDDMLYAQHLFKNGNDLQWVWVLRRDENQRTSNEVNSVALKYHGFIGSIEFDFLFAEHYQDTIVGIGGAFSLGGSVVRGDWVMADTDDKHFNNVVANISYSWTAWNKNVTGSIEYFYNDFGTDKSELSLTELSSRQELVIRVARGELFTLSRDYLASSVLIEMAPLWLLTSNVFYNLNDNSSLVQVVSQYDITQNSQLVAALSTPIGPKSSEFGGFLVNSDSPRKYSSYDWSFFAQFVWYF